MTASGYILEEVDGQILASLHEFWITGFSQHADDLPLDSYEMALNWAKKIFDEKSTPASESSSIAVLDEVSREPVAIATFRVAHPKHKESWAKVLNITVSPKFDLRLPEKAKQNSWTRGAEFGKIAGALIIGSIIKAGETESRTIKFYASNDITLDFFELVADKIREEEKFNLVNLNADTHGNWLVFTVEK